MSTTLSTTATPVRASRVTIESFWMAIWRWTSWRPWTCPRWVCSIASSMRWVCAYDAHDARLSCCLSGHALASVTLTDDRRALRKLEKNRFRSVCVSHASATGLLPADSLVARRVDRLLPEPVILEQSRGLFSNGPARRRLGGTGRQVKCCFVI